MNTNFSLQSFGPGELSYTFVIETDNGRTLVHPQLPEPKAIREEPVVIIISDLETSPGKIPKLLLFCCERRYYFIRGWGVRVRPGLPRGGRFSSFLQIGVDQACFLRSWEGITLLSALYVKLDFVDVNKHSQSLKN